MGYWKSKVLPKIKKVFEKDSGVKKAAAAEASKSFNDSKEEYSKEVEEKKTELQPKVVEIYEALSADIKTLVKEPKDAGLKKHSAGVQKFLDELVKIEFPGAKTVSEASSKFGVVLVSGPIQFVMEKVSTFIVLKEDEVVEKAADETATATGEEEKVAVEGSSGKEEEQVIKEKEIVIEQAAGDTVNKIPENDQKQDETVEKKTEPAESAAAVSVAEPTKVEEPAKP